MQRSMDPHWYLVVTKVTGPRVNSHSRRYSLRMWRWNDKVWLIPTHMWREDWLQWSGKKRSRIVNFSTVLKIRHNIKHNIFAFDVSVTSVGRSPYVGSAGCKWNVSDMYRFFSGRCNASFFVEHLVGHIHSVGIFLTVYFDLNHSSTVSQSGLYFFERMVMFTLCGVNMFWISSISSPSCVVTSVIYSTTLLHSWEADRYRT